MRTLTDGDLLRISGLAPTNVPPLRPIQLEKQARMIRGLRRAIALLPATPFTTPPSGPWMIFATAVTIAYADSDGSHHDFVPGIMLERAISQLAGLLRNEDFATGETYQIIDGAADKHWLEGQNRDGDLTRYRPTLLGESFVQSAGAQPTPAGQLTGPSKVDRLRAFRDALNAFLTPMFDHGSEQDADLQKHAVVQDAWIDLGDVVADEEPDDVHAILQTVTTIQPDYAFDTWRKAQEQLGRLIVRIGHAEKRRLEAARHHAALIGPAGSAYATGLAMRALFNLTPTKSTPPATPAPANEPSEAKAVAPATTEVAPVQPAVGPAAVPAPPIDYITRDQAAALCRNSKDTIERWFKEDANAPDPVIEGGGGRAHRYDYAKLRPWLERRSGGMRLPERMPEI